MKLRTVLEILAQNLNLKKIKTFLGLGEFPTRKFVICSEVWRALRNGITSDKLTILFNEKKTRKIKSANGPSG